MLILSVILKILNVMKVVTQKNIMSMFLVVMLIKLFVLMIDLVNRLLFLEVKMLIINVLKQFLKNISTVKKIMKGYFNKNLVMTEEEGHLFQQSNSYWICKKLIDNDDEKVRDHCHVTGKFRGSAH